MGWIIGIAVVVLLVLFVIGIYNHLVALRNKVRNGWSQIDVQLKQRIDLIPNLVQTVKGYAAHESSVLEEVTRARAGVMQAAADPHASVEQRAQAEQELSRSLVNLRATVEAYPDLKANTNFMDLQSQLAQIEQRIAYARQFYNDVVLKYNTAIETVPNNIVAGLFHFTAEKFFEATGEDRAVPQVQF